MLEKGNTVAIVSLSWGGLGDESLIHKYYIAKERLERDFGLNVITMPNALKGIEFVYNHPELRAKDLMDALKDDDIDAIFCAIGGSDSIRILPYIDYDVIKNNPKIFMGYSDTTVSHFIFIRAGVVSFYGPAIMSEFGEYVKMFDYTKDAVNNILFKDTTHYEIKSSPYWSKDYVAWKEDNMSVQKKLDKEEHGYEVLSGLGKITGELLGGCIDVFPMINGTCIWPNRDEWKDKIMLLETSDEKMSPDYLLLYMRNLGAQGILNNIKGIIVGKPQDEKYYEEYKEVYLKVLKEFKCENLPIIYNINIGHAFGTGILPLGIKYEVDLDNKTIKLLESATK
jgi:muramoyltetrapeptide carboxypeptidase LdcA involved in peptidoglycan recycling